MPGAAASLNRNPLWFWSTLAALAGWVLTTIWFVWHGEQRNRSRPVAAEAREPALFRKVESACKNNDGPGCRRALRQWGQLRFATRTAPTISELCLMLDHQGLVDLLQALDQSLYAGERPQWRGAQTREALVHWRKRANARERKARPADLPPLYN